MSPLVKLAGPHSRGFAFQWWCVAIGMYLDTYSGANIQVSIVIWRLQLNFGFGIKGGSHVPPV